jgi:hypothetical protein
LDQLVSQAASSPSSPRQGGTSAQADLTPPSVPRNAADTAGNHVLSRHSLVGQMAIAECEDEIELPPINSLPKTADRKGISAEPVAADTPDRNFSDEVDLYRQESDFFLLAESEIFSDIFEFNTEFNFSF